MVWALLLLPSARLRSPVLGTSMAIAVHDRGRRNDPSWVLNPKAEDNVVQEEMVGEDTEMLEVVDAFESE